MNEFLDFLKEEVLPGIWSRGVALSRNSKSVEKISPNSEKRELKFKIQTTERMLAFQVTLWPDDQDSFCNCGSKIEPCHHIVAVALAVAAGHVAEPSANPVGSVLNADGNENHSENTEKSPANGADSATVTRAQSGARLAYSWVVEREKIILKRELVVNGIAQRLDGTLVGLIGGIQSGRVKMPLPSTTPEDLKLDELFAQLNPSWAKVLRALSDLPPLPAIGIAGNSHLKASPKPLRDQVLIEDVDGGGMRISKLPTIDVDQKFSNGIVRIGDTLMTREVANPFSNQTIAPSHYAQFLTDVLPRLQEDYELEIRVEKLPEFTESEPELFFKIESLGENIVVTPEVHYPTDVKNAVIKKDAEKERELFKELRSHYGLAPKTPTTLGPKEILKLRDQLALRSKGNAANESATGGSFSNALSKIDFHLADFLKPAKVELADALAQKDLLMKLLLLRDKRPEVKQKFNHFLGSLRGGRDGVHADDREASDKVEGVGYFHKALLPQLRGYQSRGSHFLNRKRSEFGGAILADDMGLGKTVQTLTLLEGRNLVVAPTSLLANWKNEAARFRGDLRAGIYHGPNRSWDPDANLVITSYAILRMEPEKFLETVWDTVVLDEAHIIRNSDTQAAIASFQLNAKFRLALTGTPIQNRKHDLLSLFQFVTPGLFEFEDELDDRLVKNLILRRTKAEVLPELPPKTYLEHSIELTASERAFYNTIFAAAKRSVVEKLESGEKVNPLTLFEVLLRSREVLDHPALVDAEQGGRGSSKLDRILEVVDDLIDSGQSVLLYSQWTGFLNILETRIKDRYRYLRLDGSTTHRADVVEKFQTSAEPTVFLLSLHAGGVGLNLTRATHVLFCEPWWNPYVELQAEDRAYRLGQEKPVTIHRFTTMDSIEESLSALKSAKMQLGDSILSQADAGLNLNDISKLIHT